MRMKFKNPPGIIPSLDVELREAKRLVEGITDLKREVAALKIGSLLCWKHGLLKVVSEIKDLCDFPVIFDAQKGGTDIPEIVKMQIEIAAEAGVDAFIAGPQGSGSVTLETFVKSCNEHGITPIIVLEMTHPGANDFLTDKASERILEISLDLGVENFVAPANKPERLRLFKNTAREKKKHLTIFSPGVGPQGGGPDSAVFAGADFIIAGRSIYQAENPKEKIISMFTSIKNAYEKRKRLQK